MRAHDFIQPRNRILTSKGVWFGGILGFVKFLKCIGVFMMNDLLMKAHVVQLLFMIRLICSCLLIPVQKPFSGGKTLRKSEWHSIGIYSILLSFGQILWFYGVTLCGPVRAILIYEHSSLAIISALSAAFTSSGSPAKVRGAILLALGVVSLIILDRDVTVPHIHSENHSHQSGLNHMFYHFINWFGIADHKGGVVILLIALLVKAFCETLNKKISADIGGPRRLNALASLISTIALCPWAIFTLWSYHKFMESFITFLLLAFVVTMLVFVVDFYAETTCSNRLDPLTVSKFVPIACFLFGLLLSYVWFEPYRTASPVDLIHGHGMGLVEHGFSGGLMVTVVFFVFASFALASGDRVKARAGQFVGYSSSGLPLYIYGEDFLHKTSQSVVTFAKSTLKQVLANQDSRRIFYFLCLNLVFTFVEFIYGIFTNSLGLISDAFHMFFDCSALVIGLIAAVMSTWPRTRQFSYGYGRIEILSGFINGLFLIVIACFIFCEAFKRIFSPPEIHTGKLLFVSIAGLLVNLFGIAVFHGGHGHSHGGGGGSHGHSATPTPCVTDDHHGHSHASTAIDMHGHDNNHGHSHDDGHGHSHDEPQQPHGHSHNGGGGHQGPSHGGHGHSHNANMQGVFLHILADTFGSVGVIISSLLIQFFGWHVADPVCSLLLSVLIFLSVIPLLKQSMSALLLQPAEDADLAFKQALEQIMRLDGVISYSIPHLWQVKSDNHVCTLHIQASNECDQQKLAIQISNILKNSSPTQAVVQIEKEFFQRSIFALCPSYEMAPLTFGGHMGGPDQELNHRRPFQDSILVKSI